MQSILELALKFQAISIFLCTKVGCLRSNHVKYLLNLESPNPTFIKNHIFTIDNEGNGLTLNY